MERKIMKKFLIALCGILVIGNALAGPSHYQVPHYVGLGISNSWKATGGNYTNSLSGSSLYTDLATQMSKVSSSNHGTHDDEGAVVLIMARKIYANGGDFCTTQVQAANHNGRRYTWIDYYDYPGKYKCETLCRRGYWGPGCAKTGTPDSCHTDKLDFGTLTKKTTGGWDYQKTNSIDVFLEDNAEASTRKTAEQWILAVVKKMDHGVIVSPVSVIAERYQDSGKKSYITSVNSRGQEVLLCARGYEPNASGTDCQEPSWCRQQRDFDKLCPEYSTSDYQSDIHKVEYDAFNKCNVIRCDYDNYGFKSKNDLTCIECAGGELAYVNADGLCDTCQKGEYPKSSGNGCDSQMETYSQIQMKSGPNGNRECWLETDPEKFGGCVICSTNNQCWNGKNCTTCD